MDCKFNINRICSYTTKYKYIKANKFIKNINYNFKYKKSSSYNGKKANIKLNKFLNKKNTLIKNQFPIKNNITKYIEKNQTLVLKNSVPMNQNICQNDCSSMKINNSFFKNKNIFKEIHKKYDLKKRLNKPKDKAIQKSNKPQNKSIPKFINDKYLKGYAKYKKIIHYKDK